MHCSVLSFPSFQKTLPMFPWRLSCVFSKAASLFPAQSQLWNLGEVSDLPQLSLISLLHEYNVCTVISPMEAEGRAVSPVHCLMSPVQCQTRMRHLKDVQKKE